MPDAYAIASHFEGKEPVVSEIYTHLLEALRHFGQVVESPKKTSIHLDNRHGFAGVATRKSYILLNFRTSNRIDSPRIHKIEPHSANRLMYTVKLQSSDDIDAELLGWLKSAYELGGGTSR